jgi:hypothetical protein
MSPAASFQPTEVELQNIADPVGTGAEPRTAGTRAVECSQRHQLFDHSQDAVRDA